MTALEALPIIAGFLAVWITSLINRPGTNPTTKRVVAVAVSIVLGLLSLLLSGQIAEVPPGVLEWVNRAVVYLGLTIVASQGFYRAFEPAAKTLEATVNSGPAAEESPSPAPGAGN